MLSYRHAFHAGNHADVFKHTFLVMLLERFNAKETPYTVIDTHAGSARYDLNDECARKTLDAQSGIRNCSNRFRTRNKRTPPPSAGRFQKLPISDRVHLTLPIPRSLSAHHLLPLSVPPPKSFSVHRPYRLAHYRMTICSRSVNRPIRRIYSDYIRKSIRAILLIFKNIFAS